ncbi:MAG TPA: hypothetical protein VH092_14275, partial [Urbifossiella sp.]|nr:hypothetical protein [Urbifossiella sp.]
MPDPAPLVVFADDWGRHPSSAQHLIAHLLPTRPVVWVNTIGTRPPRLDRETFWRVVEKLRQWMGRKPGGSPEQPNPPGPPSLGGKGGDDAPTLLTPGVGGNTSQEAAHLEHPSPPGGGAGG